MIKTYSLDGEWQFRDVASDDWRAATVPGCVQLDLMNLGDLPDPFYRMNEVEAVKLEPKEWVYRRSFELGEEDLEADQIDLLFEGLDTYADIYVNDVFIGSADNMFMRYWFDITQFAETENTLTVYLHSPLNTIKDMERNSDLDLKGGCESARPYIRKAQYAYGWDWGPRIAQVGIWRPVQVRVIRTAELSNPYVYTKSINEDGTATLHVEAAIRQYDVVPLQARIAISLDGEPVVEKTVSVDNLRGTLGFETTMTIDDAQLWWPNGLGDQPLYDVEIILLASKATLDTARIKTGIRTVRLIQEEDVEGKSFIIEINGRRVFCKGANWIPADNLLPRLDAERYESLIEMAAEANMNMLRIWGGGLYEDPAFYEACDRLGIMVWQDFMYACAQYPDEFEWFRDSAREEAIEVVSRLRNYPSIVLWCGNNENNWGFADWWGNGVPEYLGNTIYRQILPKVCGEVDPSRPYWVSSPYGGDTPNSEKAGDRHQWSVWSNWQDYSGYLADNGRFLSEFGFQAMPNWKTVLSYTEPEDRTILSDVVRSHNKMKEGTERLVRFLVGRVGFPKDFRSFVYLTQFNQAEAVKTAVEHWRLRMFNTAGALYWQINDCWPVASWASIDYYGRKKALYHYTGDFFADVLPVLVEENGELILKAASDRIGETAGTVRLTSYTLAGELRAELSFPVTLQPNSTTVLKHLALEDLGIGHKIRVMPVDQPSTTNPHELNGDLFDTVVYVELDLDGDIYTNYKVFQRFRSMNLAKPNIAVSVEDDIITLISDVPAFGVFIEPENDVDMGGNCLNMEPGVEYEIECSSNPGAIEVFDLTSLVAKI